MITEGLKKTAVLCVLKCKDEFLLLKRFKEPNKDMYTPVGGKLDPFETPLQAAVRETREETGIVVENMKYHGTLTETSPSKYNWISFIYSAEIAFQPAPDCNEGILKWINRNELLDIPTPKTDWFIYKYILENRVFAFNAVFEAKLNLVKMQDDLTGEVLFKLNQIE